jgi:hypothetical protein
MRPVRPFYCALLLDSELDSNLNCFWPPPRGLEPDQPWTSLLTWKTLLDIFYSIPCTNHGRMHGCHVLINSQTSFWVQWSRMDASQLRYPKQCIQARNTSFASFYLSKVSEMLRNTPKHYFGSNVVEWMLHNFGTTK